MILPLPLWLIDSLVAVNISIGFGLLLLGIYIPTPARVRPDHPIAKIIGVDALMALAEVYGAEDHFPLPKAERAILAVRNARIARAYETHKTARELAAENNLTERQIERILSAAGVTAPVDRRQGSLF